MVQEFKSPTRVSTTRLFFLGGSCNVPSFSPCFSDLFSPGFLLRVGRDDKLSSLGAGVNGRAGRFLDTDGETICGRLTYDVDGVVAGVATVDGAEVELDVE
jgi:hypothetical protein